MRFITDYHRLNQQLVRNPYPLPRIGDTMQKLEVFQYATALDLNIVYYTRRLSPAIKDMATIATKFEEFRYNCLPMGICASEDIFQAKVDNLVGDIEGVKTYIDDIIVLSKYCLGKHIEHMIMIFGILRAAGLKIMRLSTVWG